MTGFFTKWVLNTAVLMVVVWLLPGIWVDQWDTIIIAALILGFFNAFLRPLLILFTLPLQILSLGVFTLIINGLLFYLVSEVVAGFYVASFWSALGGSILFSMFSFFLNLLIEPKGTVNMSFREYRFNAPSKDSDVIDVEATSDEDDDKRLPN